MNESRYQKFLDELTPYQQGALLNFGQRVNETLTDYYSKCQMPMRSRVLCNLRPRTLAALNWTLCYQWLNENNYCNSQLAARSVAETSFISVAFPNSVQDEERVNAGIIAWENSYLVDKDFDRADPPKIKRKRRTSEEVRIALKAKLALGKKRMGRPPGSRNKKTSLKWILQGLAPEMFELTMWFSRNCPDCILPQEIQTKLQHVSTEVEKARA